MSPAANELDLQPLIKNYQADSIIAFGDGVHVTQQHFLQQVVALSQLLPEQPYCINLCRQRYHFLLLFCAVAVRGGVNILPANDKSATITSIHADYADACCLADFDYDFSHHRLEQWLDQIQPLLCEASYDMPQLALQQLVAIAYTSGSTGKPQANEKRWGMLVGTAVLLGQRLETEHQALVATVPPQHMYGLETSVMMSLCCNSALYIADTFYPQDIQRAFAQLQDASMTGVLVTTPVHLQALEKSELSIEGIEKIISATAPLFPALTASIEQRYATTIEEIYGFTEAGSVATRRTAVNDQWQLLEGMRLLHSPDGLSVIGAQLPGARPVHDMIELLQEGRSFRLMGRSGELLNVAGKRIALAELHQQLASVEGVVDAAVLMPESQSASQRPAAIVVLKETVSKRLVQAALAQKVDAVFIPRPFIVVDKIERNATGKPQRQALLELLEQHGKTV